MPKNIYQDIARDVAEKLGINFEKEKFTLDDFARGMEVEYEHGTENPATNVTNDDPIMTGKIALAHLYEPRGNTTQYDYYDGLEVLENAPPGYWRGVNASTYWLNKKIGLGIIIVLLLISIYLVWVNRGELIYWILPIALFYLAYIYK